MEFGTSSSASTHATHGCMEATQSLVWCTRPRILRLLKSARSGGHLPGASHNSVGDLDSRRGRIFPARRQPADAPAPSGTAASCAALAQRRQAPSTYRSRAAFCGAARGGLTGHRDGPPRRPSAERLRRTTGSQFTSFRCGGSSPMMSYSRSRQQQRVFPLGELVTAPNGDWDFLILSLILQISLRVLWNFWFHPRFFIC
jgi:hypothetical protein